MRAEYCCLVTFHHPLIFKRALVVLILISALFLLNIRSMGQGDENTMKGEIKTIDGYGTGQGEGKRAGKEKVELSGYWYTKMRSYGASGNKGRFLSQEGLYTYGGRIEQGSDLTLLLQFGERLNLMGRVFDLPYQERSMTFDLNAGLVHVRLGDFVASLEGGEFSNFSKKITGTMVEYKTNRLKLTGLTSQVKSTTKTESFRGRNIKGPYDLRGTDLIIEGYYNARTRDVDCLGREVRPGESQFRTPSKRTPDCWK